MSDHEDIVRGELKVTSNVGDDRASLLARAEAAEAEVTRLREALEETECWCQPTRDHVEGLYGSEPFICPRCVALAAEETT